MNTSWPSGLRKAGDTTGVRLPIHLVLKLGVYNAGGCFLVNAHRLRGARGSLRSSTLVWQKRTHRGHGAEGCWMDAHGTDSHQGESEWMPFNFKFRELPAAPPG